MSSTSRKNSPRRNRPDNELLAQMMLQNALHAQGKDGIDSYHVARLQLRGLVKKSVTAPHLPEGTVEMIRDPSHPVRRGPREGPLIYFLEPDQISILEPYGLLLHPDRDVRCAAIEHLRTAAVSEPPWLTPGTLKVVEEVRHRLASEEPNEWREAGIKVFPDVRDDYMRLLGGLLQSLQAHHDEGISEYLVLCLRPTWLQLARLRPPVLNPVEQSAEISERISEYSKLGSIWEALTKYINTCGYVPLNRELSAAKLFEQWRENHGAAEIGAGELRQWLDLMRTPFAEYHWVEIALAFPELFRENEELTAQLLVKIIEVGKPVDSDYSAGNWDVYCTLASHFLQHLEAVHPGLNGVQASCCAWWLTHLLCNVLLHGRIKMGTVLEKAILPEAGLSRFRRNISRSPVAPSTVRFLTLHAASIWAMSAIALTGKAHKNYELESLLQRVGPQFSETLRDYIVTTPLVSRLGEATAFAYQDNSDIVDLCESTVLFTNENGEVLKAFSQARIEYSDPSKACEQLSDLLQLDLGMQHFTLANLRDAVCSTDTFDKNVGEWLERGVEVVEVLNSVAIRELQLVHELMAEYQQRHSEEWASRLPHLIAWAIEKSTDKQRAGELFASLLLMSINGGAMSPIQRAMTSPHRQVFLPILINWRQNLLDVARVSEPWVAGRIRAMCATISRIVGPRKFDTLSPTLEPVPSEKLP